LGEKTVNMKLSYGGRGGVRVAENSIVR